jgi:twitching motility two-component system response regulator PilG
MNKVSISHIGLSAKDQLLIKNLSRLSNTVMGQFLLLQDALSPEGDVLMIDADSENAQQLFLQMQRFKKFHSILCIRNTEDKAPDWLPNANVLTRPLVLRRVTQMFEQLLENNQIETASSSGHAILVVDDALPVRTFMKQRLHDLLGKNVAVDLASGGEEALALVAKNKYELIFLDVVMPDMDGYHVCREIKSHHRMPVVMLTSKSSTLNKVKAKMSGCNGYITKPPSDEDLNKELVRHLPGAFETHHQMHPQTI